MEYGAKWYKKQLLNDQGDPMGQLTDIVQAVNSHGEGVVQLKGGPSSILRMVTQWNDFPKNEELWLAQEDIWVQRELLWVIRDANDSFAVYRAAAKQPTKGPEEIDHKVFANPAWELDLVLAKNAKRETVLRGSLTNKSKRRMWLDIPYK